MNYERFLIEDDARIEFVKHHNPLLFSDHAREQHSREYLLKEHAMMRHVRDQDFAHVPAYSRLIGDSSLVMEGLSENMHWHWRAPSPHSSYLEHTLSSLTRLSQIDAPDNFLDSHAPSHVSLVADGWRSVDSTQLEQVSSHLYTVSSSMHPRFQMLIPQLVGELYELRDTAPNTMPSTHFCHHDMRQANIAWHPDGDVKIVDWSWAGLGPEKADHTSLLIDLHKSGHDVTEHLDEHFDADHAHSMVGFLLARSIAPSLDPASTVRLHQAASAVSAYALMQQVGGA